MHRGYRTNPAAGHRAPPLPVCYGKSIAVTVTQALSVSLNGEGIDPQIFISCLAVDATKLQKASTKDS
jgi:hypothetical protein